MFVILEGPIGYCFKDLSHINIQECIAVLNELERQVRHGFTKCRYIIAIDSRVYVRSLEAINKILNAVCAFSDFSSQGEAYG